MDEKKTIIKAVVGKDRVESDKLVRVQVPAGNGGCFHVQVLADGNVELFCPGDDWEITTPYKPKVCGCCGQNLPPKRPKN